ncbi:MAG: DegV family protein [Cellulosilyticaceae bacterium]
MTIKLITDSASDLPITYVQANDIDVASLEVNIKGEFHRDDLGQTLTYDTFYNLLREGEMTSTSQVNVHTFEEMFESYVKEERPIIFIGLASVLSGTVTSARMARENILERYPEADITIIDSKSASLGEGALVYYACEMIKAGKGKEEIVEWVEAHCSKVIHAITVDDLGFLKRGGRISGVSSVVGTLLNIKPSVYLDNEGKVLPGIKLKGTKQANKYIVKEVLEKGTDLENQTLFICHGDVLERAETVKEMILEQVKVKDIIINHAGAVIGTHVGPGTIGVMFLGNER